MGFNSGFKGLNIIHITQHVHTYLMQPGDGKIEHVYPVEIEHGVWPSYVND